MPAIKLEQLKAEIAGLAWLYTRPVEFHKHLKELLDTYGDHMYRPGVGVYSTRLIELYHTAPLVINQVEKELVRLGRENPPAGFPLAAELWQDEYLEVRQIAAFLLGKLPVDPSEPVLELIRTWCSPQEEPQSIQAALRLGGTNLRARKPEAWLDLCREWAGHSVRAYHPIGLIALGMLVEEPGFQNLPPVFQIAIPLVREAQPALMDEIISLLIILEKHSPSETFFFLRQALLLQPQSRTVRLIRRLLPSLGSENQVNLRALMAQYTRFEADTQD